MDCYLRCINSTKSPIISVKDENQMLFNDIEQYHTTEFIPYPAGTSYITALDFRGNIINTVTYGFIPYEQYTITFK